MNIRILAVLLCGLAWLACPALAETMVTADFTAGNDDTTYVDAFHGIAGDGWTTPWGENDNGKANASITNVVTDTNPILGAGNKYLSSTVDANGESDVRFAVGREHGAIDETVVQHVEFTVRIDEDVDGAGSTFKDYQDRYAIQDGPSGVNTPSSSATWQIFGYGGTGTYCPAGREGEWTFCNGVNSGSGSLSNATWPDTNIPLVQGGVYEFAIDLYPEEGTWDCEVTHVNATYSPNSFKETGMGWRDSTVNGDYIYFSSRAYSGDDVRAFSVDGVSIAAVPEPGVLLLLVTGFAVLLTSRRRR